MEYKMGNMKKLFALFCFFTLIFIKQEKSIKAETLEIVFKSSLWGAAIGAVGGLAFWALQDADGDDKIFSKYVVRNSAIGIFGGMAFGIYDAGQNGGLFMSNENSSLFNYNLEKNKLTIKTILIVPKINYSDNILKREFKFFTMLF